MAEAKPIQRPNVTLPETTYIDFALNGWRKNPDKVAVVDINTSEELTYSQLEQRVRSFAGSLQTLGVGSQTKVQFYADNSINSLVAQQACFFCNASVFAFKPNKSTRYPEYKFQTEDAEIEYVLTDAVNYDVAVHRLLNDPACQVKKIIILSGVPKNPVRESFVLSIGQLPKGEFREPTDVRIREDVLAVSYTSGSTGLPKGVMHSHHSFVSALHIMGPDALQAYIESDRFLLLSTLTYVTGTIFSSGTLSCGGTLVLASHDVDAMIPAYVDQYKATVFMILECPMKVVIDNSANYPNVHSMIRSLRVILVGGTVFPEPLRVATERFFEGAKFMNVYGMTEAFGLIACSEPTSSLSTHVGFVSPNFEVKIVNDKGLPVRVGDAGELLWRGPQLTLGYWKRSSEDFTDDGFYATGDMAVVDELGRMSLVGRKKHFIICLDERVAPTEIEDLLLCHPAVREAIVVGTPHPVVQEAPTAMIVLNTDQCKSGSLDQLRRDLIELVSNQLCDNKHLHGGVHFVDSLAKTDSGKYARSAIAQGAVDIMNTFHT